MRSRNKQLLALFTVCSVFLLTFHFRAAYLSGLSEFWQVDDGCYLARLGSILGSPINGACQRTNYFAPGITLLWLPAGVLARALPIPSFEQALVQWVSLFSFAFWGVAFWSSWIFLERCLAARLTMIAALSVCFAVPAFYYAIHRQTLVHPAEWMLVSVFVCTLGMKKGRFRFLISSAACALLILTRYNEAPALLMLAAREYEDRQSGSKMKPFEIAACVGLAAASAWVGWIAFARGYGGDTLISALRAFDLRDFLSNFFGLDHGVIWINPWLVSQFCLGAFCLKRLSWTGRAAFAWIGCEMLLSTLWGGGGIFGNRYLTGAFAAALWIFSENKNSLRQQMSWLVGCAAFSLVLCHQFISMSALGIGIVHVTGGDGATRRLMTAPFLETALGSIFDPSLLTATLNELPVFAWRTSTFAAVVSACVLACWFVAGFALWSGSRTIKHQGNGGSKSA